MKKLDAGDVFFIILGLLLLALAGAVAFSAYGHVKILAILGIAVIVKFIEVYTIPLAIILALFGIVILIFGLKGSD